MHLIGKHMLSMTVKDRYVIGSVHFCNAAMKHPLDLTENLVDQNSRVV